MTETINISFLESLIGYNTRRATLSLISTFIEQMKEFDLSPVDFSILSLIGHNPNITSKQICSALNIQPPNIVAFIKAFDRKGLIVRSAHPTDGRATGLSLSSEGKVLMKKAEKMAIKSEMNVASKLDSAEVKVLIELLQKIYKVV